MRVPFKPFNVGGTSASQLQGLGRLETPPMSALRGDVAKSALNKALTSPTRLPFKR